MKKMPLADELEQLLEDLEEEVQLVRCFARLGRWDGAIEELRRLARSAERDGVALVIGARSEETIEQHRTPNRTPSRGQQVTGDDGSTRASGSEAAPRGARRGQRSGQSTKRVETAPAECDSVGRRGSEERGSPAPSAAAKRSVA